ncbi:DUF2314 domain-containing protein [Mesorhizobium sp. BR1-1-13]|uniref:DUF2314 domain-containing protein n=1 Tax=Mesorhizobium sp. BR1-1-13 TaxID=2876656 RepID=UPI001CD1143E|nr:DUF2314 domain-containing protein [Mesorhizobium sp. BR1-1-13]MBZ9943498.1 DUF2314 domain-containing protein [Mesorhizobium sp. BR1-1-13]
MTEIKLPYRLVDGEHMSREYPDTFHIPAGYERSNVDVGRFVKLGFDAGEQGVERMWVRVTEADDNGSYTGILSNSPIGIDGLDAGDLVVFEARHILAIAEDDGLEHSENF